MKTNTPRRSHLHRAVSQKQFPARTACATRLWPLLMLLLLTLPAVVQAQFNYTIYQGRITITGYTGPGGAVVIPNTINGRTVIRIGDEAFRFHTNLTSVTIPNSVITLGEGAFSGCGLTSVMIPNSVTSIGDYAFGYCTSLSVITVDALNSVYSSVNGVLFNKSETLLIQFPGGKAGSYTIPNSTTNIGSRAFSGSTDLTSVTIPNTVITIGNDAFFYCTSLTSVMIPNSVVSIGDYAFNSCTNLTNITIPGSVTTIGGLAFVNCPSMTSVTIQNGVTSIGEEVFAGCNSLSNVTIPASLTSIGPYAFHSCTSLMAITVDAANASYSSVDGVLFDKSLATLIEYPGGKVGSYVIPGSVTSIERAAFIYCTSLTGVYFQGNAPNFGLDVFEGATNATVYYLPGTTGWGTTFADRPAVLWNPLVQTGDARFGVRTNRLGFTITGASNLVLVVEATPNLANPTWTPVGTNTLIGGSSYFSDPEWTNHPARFYRLRSP